MQVGVRAKGEAQFVTALARRVVEPGGGEGLPQVSLGFVWVDLWLVGASRATAWSNDSSGRVASIAGVGRVMAGVGRLASAVEGFASAPPQVASARLTSQ